MNKKHGSVLPEAVLPETGKTGETLPYVIMADSVSFRYNKELILNNLSLKVNKGEFVAIFGRNGSGKTTLFNILSGVLKQQTGEVTIFGKKIRQLKQDELAKLLAFVPQQTYSSYSYSNLEIVLMGRSCHINRFGFEDRDDYEKALSCMELTGTSHLADRYFGELSGGEKQRIVIAQALCQDTPILLLDEPTSNLDINYQIEIMSVISRIRKEKNLTVMGIFHDLNLALQYADRIILLDKGTVFKEGSIAEVITTENLQQIFETQVMIENDPAMNKIYVRPFHYTYEFSEENPHPKIIHLIAGGGTGRFLFYILKVEKHTLSTCVLSSIDTDSKIAREMGIPLIEEKPFVEIAPPSLEKNKKLIMDCEVVIITRVPVGIGNFVILELIEAALEYNKKVFFIDGDHFQERDFTGGKAIAFYKKMLAKGARNVKNEEEVVMLLRKPLALL